MPFTHYHLGPSSWIGLVLFKVLHYPTFLISSVIIDIEPFFVLIFNLNQPLHGISHSFLGGSIIAILCSILIYYFKSELNKIMAYVRLKQDPSNKQILLTSFFGVYLHILLDSPLYIDMKPFYPYEINPFYGMFSLQQIILFCIVSFLISILFYFFNLLNINEKQNWMTE